ncbi:MAG TPA: hypothetical protein VG225_11255 [Terracidiphilus sp.]|jgi:hypothetical protein|nr:hypothetical protein [Terracidiphilus sp.]
MRWKRWLSYRKSEWEFGDYPVAVRAQKVDPGWTNPHLKQHRYIARVEGWFLDAGGDTRCEALSALKEAFERRKQHMAENGEPMLRPGTVVPLEFASTERIDAHGDIVNEILEEILEVRGAWVSDETCLGEFTLGESTDEIFAQIRRRYGVDVSDVPCGNLAEIVERIAAMRGSV